MSLQFVFRGPAHEVVLKHVKRASGGLAAGPESDQQARDDGQIDLDGDAVAVVGQQMAATENALEPPEKEFNRPAKTVGQGNQLGVEVEATGRQQQNVGTAF